MIRKNKKIKVGILGATGMVGQRLIALLKNHPWFEVVAVAASRKSKGKKLGSLTVYSVEDDIEIIAQKCTLVFSAIEAPKDFIQKIEEAYAKKGLPVVSSNSAHRWTPDVPMIMPEINPEHLDIIPGEEEKSEKEPSKIFGDIRNGRFVLKNTPQISANCIRVPVSDGHLATINIQFRKKVSKEKLIKSLKNFKNPLDVLDLPSAPKPFLTYFEEPDRPQTKLDRDLHAGMGISVGRIREDSVLGWKCVALSHNTIRGAAGGSILNAELLVKKGYIKK